MTSYFQYNDNKTKKPARRTEHGTEIVDIPGIMVTETAFPVTEGIPTWKGTPWDYSQAGPSTNDRHGWACPCVECRSDRGEDTL